MKSPIDVMIVAHAFLVETSLKSIEGSIQIQDRIYVMNLDVSIEPLTLAAYGNTRELILMKDHIGKNALFLSSFMILKHQTTIRYYSSVMFLYKKYKKKGNCELEAFFSNFL